MKTTPMKHAFTLLTAMLLVTRAPGAEETRRIGNDHIQAVFAQQDGAWRLTRLTRVDGTDALEMNSGEFEVLLFDGQRFTVDAYQATGDPNVSTQNGAKTFETVFRRKANTSPQAPESVTVTYRLGSGPCLHKTVYLGMTKDGKVDRLQVLRFSTPQKAARGGEGQPVYIGNWFLGMDYPGFYSRHSDGFKEPDFNYRWHYTIDLEGRDVDAAPRAGLVTLFHFPGYAKQQADGSFGIMSKRAVIGIARKPGEGPELALMDYIAETRKPPRSSLQFNNWYSPDAKAITVDSFANKVGRTIVGKLKEQGAHLDNMVPDAGWQRRKDFQYIYQPALHDSHDPLPKVSAALQAIGTRLGIWIALDGTGSSIERGLELGYRDAYGNAKRRERWMEGKSYFDIIQPKYQADLKKALQYLIAEAGVDYIKHDFNHNFTTHYLSERHAREACLDVTLDLLAYERALNPKIFQNYTNGSWFSPFWLQYVDTLWMMSGDSGGGGGGAWPALSSREGATSYRDAWFYQSFNNPARCVRPAALPIANFMTHGILCSTKKGNGTGNDTLRDWSDYCVMYFARGTLLKELYISINLLDDDYWKILGRAAAWAQQYQQPLLNTVLIGGDCSQGQAYGYVSWVGDKAILTVRNPDRRFQTLEVPFDASVYCRGTPGKAFKARAIYPYVEEMPWKLVSGQAFKVGIPGDTTVIYEIAPGPPVVDHAVAAEPLLPFTTEIKGDALSLHLRIPSEETQRCDLLVQPWGTAVSQVELNSKPVEADRHQVGKGWSLSAYDLRKFRGQTVEVKGRLVSADEPKLPKDGKVPVEVWLVVDRKVNASEVPDIGPIPFPIAQDYRRQTQCLLAKTNIAIVKRSNTPSGKEP
jgi:hypothetical protein